MNYARDLPKDHLKVWVLEDYQCFLKIQKANFTFVQSFKEELFSYTTMVDGWWEWQKKGG